MENFNEESQPPQQPQHTDAPEPIGPDYIAMQYRKVRVGNE